MEYLPDIKLVEQLDKTGIRHILGKWRALKAGRGVIRDPILLKAITSEGIDLSEEARVKRGDRAQGFQVAGASRLQVNQAARLAHHGRVDAEFV